MAKAKSKSVEKREAVQKKGVPDETGEGTESAQGDPVPTLEARVAKLEAQQALVAEGFQFGADETRGLFGLAPIALVFGAIAKKLR